MKRFYLLLFVCFLVCCVASANEPVYVSDTTMVVNNQRIRIKAIDAAVYEDKYQKNIDKAEPPAGLTEIADVTEALGKDFSLTLPENEQTQYEGYITDLVLSYKGDTLHYTDVCEGLREYYPNERILVYWGGHGSDCAIDVDSGESTDNPYYRRTSDSRKIRLAGVFSGQVVAFYYFEKLNSATGQYDNLFDFYDISINKIWSKNIIFEFHKCFFEGETLYFCTHVEGDSQYDARHYSVTFLD